MRAKWIVKTYLKNPICFYNVREMFGYTRTYKGKSVSVQGTGTGIPSALIYFHELITNFNVQNRVRVGSSCSY
jgi:purine-nucleoside phosphorylase